MLVNIGKGELSWCVWVENTKKNVTNKNYRSVRANVFRSFLGCNAVGIETMDFHNELTESRRILALFKVIFLSTFVS